MIRHVALLTFAQDTTDAQAEAIATALWTLPTAIPQLQAYAIGRDLGINEGNSSFAVVADFATIDDYLVYRDHPEHRRIITELIMPVLASRMGAQYELPS